MNVVERYVLLGLRLGRHVEGLVDAYYGPPELAAEVESEPLQGVDQLAAEGESLLAAVAAADELEPGRRAWLGDQVRGLRTYAGVLAGETIGYADEVEGCYGVRPEPIDEAPYRQAHEQLDELLPGEGSLLERYASWRAADAVPSDRIADCIRDVTAVLRETTWALVRPARGRGAGRRGGPRRAVVGLQLLPRRAPQPRRRQRRRADDRP